MEELLSLLLPRKNKFSHQPTVSQNIQGVLAVLTEGVK